MKKKILITEDEPQIVELIKLSLGEEYEFSCAYNGKEALNALESFTPDMIILDIMMPEMNGYQVLEELKKNEKQKDIPIMFLTAKGEWNDKMKALAMGATEDYITKPFDPEDLKIRVERILMK